jgi:RNA polymerase sigma-70 factor (ECF subfamily)
VSLALDSEVPAFREIFDRHAPVVRRYLAQRLKNNASADEATQETFVRALRRLPSLRDPRLLRPWLLGIARRVSSEHRRAEERRLRLVVPTDAEQVEASAVSLDTPESQLLDHEDLRLVNAAVEGLQPERRRALSCGSIRTWAMARSRPEARLEHPQGQKRIHRARLGSRRCWR